MKLTQTPESIVPEQSVIDSWPKLYRKKGSHDHPVCNGVVLKDQDIIILNADEAKFYAKYLEAVSYAP
ncbi:hypothetical protein CDG60_12370 [Acinetobacter chinensis]|uniref:Uncharacterized protein n=1 Tax=Acinetobacter chinensis TaxID=2004650 RepID=A0A3B7LWY5_9GAMM|nr:hypothetical protein [Acinetobacter chinensis]AXY57292.1 hypothetical protein CDG60_12370 [Acinetobacter chinensis]